MVKTVTFLMCYFFVGSICLFGQIGAESIANKLKLVNNKEVKALRADEETSFKQIKQRKDWRQYDLTFTDSPKNVVWLKFEIENRSRDTVYNFMYCNHNFVTTYQINGINFKISKNGNLFPKQERTNKKDHHFTKLKLAPFQKSLVYVKLNSNTTDPNPRYPTLYSEMEYYKFSHNLHIDQSEPIGFIYFYITSLIVILIFALVFWLRLHERLYLYYLGYLFFQLIYGFQVLRSTSAYTGNIFAYIPKLSTSAFEPVQFIFIGFYIFFILHLLSVKKYDKLLAKLLYYLGWFCIVYAATRFVLSYFFFGLQFADTLFIVVRSIILPLNLVLIIWIIYKIKHPLLIYFIVGQSFFFIGAVLSSYIGYMGFQNESDHLFNFVMAPNIIFQIGLLAEVYCFSLALGKNVFLLQKEKEMVNTYLIGQLQENQLLQQSMNRELDRKVNEKTEELIQLYSEIEEEKQQKIKDEFKQKIKETEMVALRSQMNPHFIFNSMSAIKNLIMSSRNDDAMTYLDDFSSLLRGILENSNRTKITVEEELEIIELYLSLEKSRMGSGFNYNIQVFSKEELSQYYIPPLLLQPLVENAIWHGLHPSLKAKKELSVIFDTTENLKIIIEDNGIGRKESAKKKKLHKSMGTTIVRDRLTLYNHSNNQTIHFKITDIEENGTVLGTRIILTYQY